jgi:hypothetical protein
MMGAGEDVDLMRRITRHYDRMDVAHLVNRPLADVLKAVSNAIAVIGLAGGPTIMLTVMGVPTLMAYPEWLWPQMPGTWEPEGSRYEACRIPDLARRVDEGAIEALVGGGR